MAAIFILVTLTLFALTQSFRLRSCVKCSDTKLYMGTIAVFGGTGALGKECVYQALEGGDNVIVLARDPSRMKNPERVDSAETLMTNSRLTVLKGDVTDQKEVDAVFDAASDITGVIVALGGKTKDVGKTMLTDGTGNIVNAMIGKSSAKRISVCTSIGAGDSEKQAPMMFKALMYTVMKGIFEDKNNQEKLFLDESGPGRDLEWCLVRPGGLGIGAPTGVINVIDGQAGSIQRSDVATFMLGAVKDNEFEYIRKTPCISSVGGTGWVKEKKAGFDAATTA